MATPDDVLSFASGQVGYDRRADPEAGTRYGRWLARKTGWAWLGTNGVPYCAMFVSYVLEAVGQACPGFPTASCTVALDGAVRAGAVLADKRQARPGDIVLFDWDPERGDGPDHVGFVELNRGSHIQTIEGNTSPGNGGSQGNGGGVHRRTRSWAVVSHIVRPPYSGAAQAAPQRPAAIEVDGLLGSATISALQRIYGTPVDGEVWHQWTPNRHLLPGLTTGWRWDYTGAGSPLVRAMQRDYGIAADGLAGPEFANAVIRRFGNGICDGRLDAGGPAIRGLQGWVNSKLG